MKKILFSALAALTMTFAGCKELPSVETIGTLSKTIGYAAGITCNLSGISPGCRKTMIEVLDIAAKVVPGTNETFTTAWAPVIKETVAKFVAEKKITEGEGDLIVSAMTVATKGLDYMFDVRWPKAREYKELVSAGTKGFIEGFRSVVQATAGAKSDFEYDKKEFDKAIKFLGKKSA